MEAHFQEANRIFVMWQLTTIPNLPRHGLEVNKPAFSVDKTT